MNKTSSAITRRGTADDQPTLDFEIDGAWRRLDPGDCRCGIPTAQAANKELKIGFVGVTSGPAAAWGTSNVRSMQTRAAWLNETGGVKIGDETYDINIVTFDDQKDPKRAIAGMEKMAQEGIHYVVGPNVDDGAAAVRPVAEANGIIYFPYAFPKALYRSRRPMPCSA